MTTLARSFRRTSSSRPQALSKIAQQFLNVGTMAETRLELQYRIGSSGEPKFSYGTTSHSAAPTATFVERGLDVLAWAAMEAKYLFGSLDMAVAIHDTLIEVETFNSDLSWSLKKDAVVVEGGHSNLYSEPLYWDGSQWVKRQHFTKPSCRLIRFTAKHNKAGHLGDKHKFSYNVVLGALSGNPIEYEIDPDIQNPKV
jgi:hypothetical protein